MRQAAARLLGLPQPEDGARKSLTSWQQDLFHHWSLHPWNFLTGKDRDGTPVIRTKDEKDRLAPVKPFPAHLDYVKVWIHLLADPSEEFLMADKSRQMFLTTSTLLYMLWECIFLPGRRWILSKSTEDEAKELIRDKIRYPVSIMPPWFRQYVGISTTPENRVDIELTGSYILGTPQNIADRKARGGSASGVLVDEAAFQDEFPKIVASVMPMAAKLVAITTPNLGVGGECFQSYMNDQVLLDTMPGTGRGLLGKLIEKKAREATSVSPDQVTKTYPELPGMSVKKTRANVTVVHLDYWADPSKTPDWASKIRVKMPTESAWRREYCRDWETADGAAFYKDYQDRPKRYARRLPALISASPIYCGWDFGSRNPALVMLQIDPINYRSWVFRDLMIPGMDIFSFRDLVLYLRGQRDRDWLLTKPSREKTMGWLERYEQDPAVPARVRHTPFIQSPAHDPFQYVDFAGHEANQREVTVVGSKTLIMTRAEILQQEGIFLDVHYTTTKAKVDIIRRLLMPMADTYPGLFIDPDGCPMLHKGFAGAITFAKPTIARPDPDEPAKDQKYSHTHEALGYVLANVVPLDVVKEGAKPELLGYDGMRRPVYSDPARGDSILLDDEDYTVIQ